MQFPLTSHNRLIVENSKRAAAYKELASCCCLSKFLFFTFPFFSCLILVATYHSTQVCVHQCACECAHALKEKKKKKVVCNVQRFCGGMREVMVGNLTLKFFFFFERLILGTCTKEKIKNWEKCLVLICK